MKQSPLPPLQLVTNAEMRRAESRAITGGISAAQLMDAAGAAVAAAIRERFTPRPTIVLCGPGNNGGDGLVVARLLAAAGWPTRTARLGGDQDRPGQSPIDSVACEPGALKGQHLVVDALFGSGLSRALVGRARELVEAIDAQGLACVAVDMPSGIDGDTGSILGAAPHARLTVTFGRRRPGHLLMPGRLHCGEILVADIGIADSMFEGQPDLHENRPDLWIARYPWPRPEGNKYTRGHAVVVGGTSMTGAARLAAGGALRIGAGLVTIAARPSALPGYAAYKPSILTAALNDASNLEELLSDERKNAVLLGPGNGLDLSTRGRVVVALATRRPCVLDADALSVFEDNPGLLFKSIGGPCILTPHDGEYRRLFQTEGDRLARARAAAAASGAVVLLKGYDTVIAAPDGKAAINTNAPATLATAGAGDVLAGFAVGLLAQGMSAFDAACAATWLHGEAAAEFGPGLIAEDLADSLPKALRRLLSAPSIPPS
ncbi:MAG: NAD(P)H-hydrate dehydratase [Rhodospirillaceae bacterium]|nr:NAD(P)H-hydrate dehydratase [Rhodospirillaceae bacterium]